MLSFVFIFALCLSPFAFPARGRAQAGRRLPGAGEKKGAPQKAEEAKPAESPAQRPPPPPRDDDAPEEVDEGEAVRVETNLVTLPVIASDRGGRYVPDLKSEEFSVAEDGAEQKVAFFATVSEPFTVVLLIDTSASTTVEKMRQVQDAAVAFTEELRAGDRVKVISFDDEVRDLCDFTSDRGALSSAIRATRPGKGTRLYDAFDLAQRSLRRVRGRKAVIMLTDGMDYYSQSRTFDDNRRAAEESDVVVYPVRFDTRAETEQLAREQARGGRTIDLGGVLGGRVPGAPPGAVVIVPRGSRRPDPDEGRRTDGLPDVIQRGPGDRPAGGGPRVGGGDGGPSDASIERMLDNLYRLADDYLEQMARATGGQLVRADNPSLLPRAFRQIADELGTQYALGYYPTNAARDGKYRRIRVRTTRKDVALRTRPGYRARR
ncbi:MAG TPA: VWA domain-containing protein [Pyrinomonadaceae bacterium]